MKHIVLFLIFLMLVTCVSEPPVVETQDTARLYYTRELIKAKDSLMSMPFDDEREKQRLIIDTLLDQVLNYKESAIDLMVAEKRLARVKTSIRRYKKTIDTLTVSHENLREQLKSEQYKNVLLQRQNDTLTNKIQKLSPSKLTGVEVYGVGRSGGIFSRAKEYKTNIAGQVKIIRSSMTFPQNELAKKEYKNVTMRVYAVGGANYLSVDTSFNYMGEETKILLSLKRHDFVAGDHKVKIYVNDEKQYETNFSIK